MSTPYSLANQSFSDAAHRCAQRDFYPQFFAWYHRNQVVSNSIRYATPVGDRRRYFDGELSIDRLVYAYAFGWRERLKYTVQERFREPQYAHLRDVTITEWNGATNLPSEFYKWNATFFVYGYYNAAKDVLTTALAVRCEDVRIAIIRGELPYTRQTNPRSKQSFVCVTFDALKNSGLVLYSTSSPVSIVNGTTAFNGGRDE